MAIPDLWAGMPGEQRPDASVPGGSIPGTPEIPGLEPRLAGQLFADQGAPAAGVTLRFYQPGFGGAATLVGEAVTGADGRYMLDSDLAGQLTRLDVRAVGTGGAEIPLLGPGLLIDAGKPVNLVVPADQVPPPAPEYLRLVADLHPHLDGGTLAGAREDDERRDLTVLHEATGWDARLIALAATAEKLAATTGLDPQAAYGLVRAGLPTDRVQLARVSPAGAGHALRTAVDAGLVSLDQQQIEAAQATLDSYGRATRRKLAIAGTASSYGSMLSASGLTPSQQDRFDEVFSAHTGDAAQLWQKAAGAGLPADQLKLTAQLGVLTLNSARLVADLRQQAGSSDRLGAVLVADKLYQPVSWEARLRTLAGGNDRVLGKLIPSRYQAETVEARLRAYATDLAYKVRRSHPTQVIGARVRAGELPLTGAGPAVAQDLATVLDRAGEHGFRLGHDPLHRFLDDQGGQLFAGIPAEQAGAVTTELATLYRQYQITAGDEGLRVLQEHGLRSAYQVAAMPERAFLARYGDEFPSRAEASLTWRRAQQVSAVTLNLVTAAKQAGSARLLPVFSQPDGVVAQAQEDLVRQLPTLESLFGSLDFCECSHCQSVLSPAAYLVDLLKFLDDAPGSPATPYQALTRRRPDLPHLPLTCENTNTVMPYIDIVNEILEFYLVHDRLTAAAAYDTGEATTEELLAEPQHLLPVAYDILKQARYPLAAPFDLWLATVRAFTGHFEVPFWQLLDALRTTEELYPRGGYGRAAVAYEQLGLSTGELAILTAGSPLATWPEGFGYPADATEDQWGELAGARTLARKLQVSYHELLALVSTRFVNPHLGTGAGNPLVLADPPGADVTSWEQTTVQHADGTPAGPIDYVLFHHLVRVWRRLGWSIEETDEGLVTFLPTSVDPRTGATLGPAMASALLGLAHLARLVDLLDAGSTGRSELLVLWAPLSDRRYAELFLTGTAETRDPAFEGEPGRYLTAAGVLLADHLEAVQAALQLTSDEVSQILAAAGLELATAPLRMATVSLLHRHGLLARQLDLSVADLLVLKELSGLDPFTPLAADPVTGTDQDHPYHQTIRFVETVEAVTDAGLAVSELDYLLRHRFDPVGPYRDAAEPPLALVRTLAAEIARIRAEYVVPSDPLTFTDEALARALTLVLDATVVVAFLDAWTGAAPLPPETFDEYLRRQIIPGLGEVGFLTEAEADIVFTPTGGDQAADATRRALLANALLPHVQQRLVRAMVVDTVAADQDAAPALVEALLTDPVLLDAPDQEGQPLLGGYVAAGGYGLTVRADALTGYLEVPATGTYRFAARCAAPGTEVVLRFDHLSEPSLVATATADDLAPAALVDLTAGVPYGFTLEHPAGAAVELRVRSQELPSTPVSQLIGYPRTEIDRLHRLHLLLAKTLRLAGVLGLTEVELRYLLTHRDDFAGLDLGALPTGAGGHPAAARVLFGQLLRLVGYVRLRGELAAEPADLVDLLTHARRQLFAGDDPATVADQVLTEASDQLAAITRREPETVRAAVDLLGLSAIVDGDQVTAADFIHEEGLARLWRVLSLATRLGVDPAALGRWATPAPDHAVAGDLRDTVKARYAPQQWLRVAQPIFDLLRQQRRDALVAQVLQVTGYERADQLFEHFLVDPGTEPVVQTSRLRLAISSVQTFVQRCLLNLETDVAPSSINADYWEWMKRYRVWEANRKIFLWPENWLEPEFRDDKSHLFTELEGALLESDLDTEAVEAALYGYLGGLVEIARLDVRAIYRERTPDPGGDVLHVLARTTASPHQYFYRTWSFGSWTPWEPVTASIEGDHLALVVWRNRICLFWVTFLKQAEASSEGQPAGTHAVDLTIDQLADLKPQLKVEVKLYWSTYLRGQWSDPILAEPEQPMEELVSEDFNPANEFVWAYVRDDGRVQVSVLGELSSSFRVASRHAPPTVFTASAPFDPPYLSTDGQPLERVGQGRWTGAPPAFAVHVQGETVTDQGTAPCDVTGDIFEAAPSPYTLVVSPPPVMTTKTKGDGAPAEYADDPFFYLDATNAFFVEPAWGEIPLQQADQVVVEESPVWHEFDLPEYWAKRKLGPSFPMPELAGGVPLVGGYPMRRPDDPLTRPTTLVTFDGQLIGPAGYLAEPGRLFRSGPHGALALPARRS